MNYRNEGDSWATELENLRALNQKLLNENSELHGEGDVNNLELKSLRKMMQILFLYRFSIYETLWTCYIFLNPCENVKNTVYVDCQ